MANVNALVSADSYCIAVWVLNYFKKYKIILKPQVKKFSIYDCRPFKNVQQCS